MGSFGRTMHPSIEKRAVYSSIVVPASELRKKKAAARDVKAMQMYAAPTVYYA